MRARRGLGQGRPFDIDSRIIYSRRYGLAGRPDGIIEGGIPEEWKSTNGVYESHCAQMAVYFLLLEEVAGIRAPHGFIVKGDGRREMVENTPETRAWVLGIAEQIRAARREIEKPIPVRQPAAKCRACGMREACGQRSG
jgi:CRISPR-associated exonuclease Cas4